MGLLKQLHELSVYASDLQQHNNKFTSTLKDESKKDNHSEITVVLGDWRLGDSVKRNGVYNMEDFHTIQQMKAALRHMPGSEEKYSFRFLDNHVALWRDLRGGGGSGGDGGNGGGKRPSFVLNLCDEGFTNNALMELHVPAMLEIFGIPYTGSGPTCLGMCYDKSLVRALAISVSVPVPEEICVNIRMGDKVPEITSFPRFIKPSLGDNSIGITPGSLVRSQDETEKYVNQLYNMYPDRPVLIQEYLEGTEYSVGLIGNPLHGYIRLPILEVDYSQLDPTLPPILGYESKFEPSSPYWTQIGYKMAHMDRDVADTVYKCAERLFERCMCRDYARFDFRADRNGEVKLLEVNPNPGWCWDGKLNKMAGYNDWSYGQLLDSIITAARKRLKMADINE